MSMVVGSGCLFAGAGDVLETASRASCMSAAATAAAAGCAKGADDGRRDGCGPGENVA